MLLVATASSGLLARISQELNGNELMLSVGNFDSLRETITQIKPELVLLDADLPSMEGSKGITAVRKASFLTKIILMTDPMPEEAEIKLFLAGIRGCCRKEISGQQLKLVIHAVKRGELWIRRSLTQKLLGELGAQQADDLQVKRLVAGRFTELTQREQQIAALVSSGNTNKQIARRLDISERTVKAHLTEIFRKLGINDRLMLALTMMAPVNTGKERAI